tara:strand:- start:339 stop:1223 length:885 start_codon:yes stop_codon:yes gene_type:complete
MALDILTETQHSEIDEDTHIPRIDNVSAITVPFLTSNPDLPDILIVSPTESAEMLNALYDVYELHCKLTNKTVYLHHGFLDRDDVHPTCLQRYERIHAVVKGIYERIKNLPSDIRTVPRHNGDIERLRNVLVEVISIWFIEIPEYAPILKRYASMFRKVFIDIWGEIIHEYDDFCIEQKRNIGINVVRVKSNTTYNRIRNAQFIYISKAGIVKKVCLKYPPIYYLVDVKRNFCDCPDFVFRKWKYGLMCKHLKELKNKTRCMMNIIQVMEDRTHNLMYPLKEMLTAAYDKEIRY